MMIKALGLLLLLSLSACCTVPPGMICSPSILGHPF
jgi:hypothetical protein